MEENEQLENMAQMAKNTLLESLGIRFTHISEDYLEAEMPVDKRTIQPYGLLHGGASAALAETIGSYGSELKLKGLNKFPVGLELNINHLRAVKRGKVVGKGKLIKAGRSVHVWQIEIFDEEDHLVATSRLTTMILDTK